MSTINLPYFGYLDSDALEKYYDADVDFNNTQIQVDLNFDNKGIEADRLEIVGRFINNIRIHDINNRKYIDNDFTDEKGETVREYAEQHIEELNPGDLAELLGANIKTEDKPEQLVKKLQLVRVGLYPDSLDQFATFDYSIGTELTNYLVVIFTDENGNLDYMTLES